MGLVKDALDSDELDDLFEDSSESSDNRLWKIEDTKGTSDLFVNSYPGCKISSFGVANLRNGQPLRAIRALNLNILTPNLLRPE